MTMQAIFTSLIEVHEITAIIILLMVMWMVYMLGYYHAQLDVMNHWLKQQLEEKKEQREPQKEEEPPQPLILKRELSPTEKLDEEMRRLLLKENANI